MGVTKTPRYRVVCFDMDGTLTIVPSCAYMGQALGWGMEAGDLERRYDAGEITNRDVATAFAAHFQGKGKRDVWAVLEGLPRVAGIAETVASLHARGATALITTIAWTFVANYYRERYGFDGFCGTEHEVDAAGRLTGGIGRHFDEHDKARFVEDYCRDRGIPLKEAAAVGDSRSDIPLFALVGRAIAFNANPAARERAHVSLEGPDLRVVLPELLIESK
jgi:phosphoserine phosphatase